VAEVVAVGVLAVLQEFDRAAEVRTAVHAREEAFDDASGAEIEPRDAFDRLRVQESFGAADCHLNQAGRVRPA
jgi:hypothetical protein